METEILAIDNLLDYLFADKKAIYIDDIIVDHNSNYEVSWCMDFALKKNTPVWHDTTITRPQLLQFISNNRLNYWEAFRYDDATGNIQPFTNVTQCLDTFLNENYRDVIKEWLMNSS
jgi:hypothetical protein